MGYTIKFEFRIKRWANFYFFIYNLSECHFSCRKQYNEIWIKKVGSLSIKEKAALEDFKNIRNNYRDTKSIFEKAFYYTDDPYEELKEELKTEEVASIKKIFDIFERKFNQIYKEDLPLLEKWEKELLSYANDKKRNEKIIRKIEIFYSSPIKEDHMVRCYLLLSPLEDGGGGGANIDFGNTITCEMSHNTPQNKGRIVGTIWHETIHLLFEKNVLIPLLNDYYNKDMKKISTLNELINSSLFPRGILGEEFFQLKAGDNLHRRFKTDKNQITNITNLSKDYMNNHRGIDKAYIDKVSKYLKIK